MGESGEILLMKNAERGLVSGRSGSGKSCFVKSTIKREKRVVVFDVLDEYSSIRGFRRASSLVELKKILRYSWSSGFKVAFVPKSGSEMADLHALSVFILQAQLPYKAGKDKREIILVVEEMNTCFPVTALPAKYYGFGEICSRGRHSGINVLGVTQRVAEVNTRFRGNCNWTVFFAPNDHTDLKTICNVISPKYRDTLSNLQTHYYLKYQAGTITKGKNKL